MYDNNTNSHSSPYDKVDSPSSHWIDMLCLAILVLLPSFSLWDFSAV